MKIGLVDDQIFGPTESLKIKYKKTAAFDMPTFAALCL